MAVSLVGHTHWTGTSASSNVDMSTATLLIVVSACVSSPTTYVDSQLNAYTQLTGVTAGSGRILSAAYAIGTAGSFSSTLNITPSGGGAMDSVFAGFNPTSPVFGAQTAGASSATASVLPGTVTPGGAPNLVFSTIGGDANTAITIPSGYTIVDTVVNTPYGPQGVGLAWLEQASNTNNTPTWNVTANGNTINSQLFAFTFTGGGGGGGRGLFRTPSLGGVGIGGSFFRDPLQAREQMVKRNHIYVPERYAA